MQVVESHIGQPLIEAGKMLTNLQLAVSNCSALGRGSLDLDTIIMALYLINYNNEKCFRTPEPLGPGGDPYRVMHGVPDPDQPDQLVNDNVRRFKIREEELVSNK